MTAHGQHPDAPLLARVANGDPAAFDELYTRWSPMLYGLVCRILDDPREAEDVLQDAFLHVWHKAATYHPDRSSPTTWACMIFRNKAIDRLRSRERRGRGMERIATELPLEAMPSEAPVGAVDLNETRQAVNIALATISTDERQAIELAYFSGLTQLEIAEKLSQPLGTIKARVRRGLLKLGDALKGKL
jgi:RNA polymerase sigma-70 factor (ECF subfamily)